MLKSIIKALFFLVILCNSVSAQIDIQFILKEYLELPGDTLIDLNIEDMNNDGFLDYIYRDNYRVYVIDGTDYSIIDTVRAIDQITYLLRTGNLNNDDYYDIAIARWAPSDTCLITFAMGPDYDSLYCLRIGNFYSYGEIPSELYFAEVNNQNLICIGTSMHADSTGYPDDVEDVFGRIIVYSFENSIFSHEISCPTGRIDKIKAMHNESNQFVIFQSWGHYLHVVNEYLIDDYGWGDLFILTPNMSIDTLWHAGFMSDGTNGVITSLYTGAPTYSDDDFVYFYTYFGHYTVYDSLVCLSNPNGEIAWAKIGSYAYYNFALTNILGHEFKDLFVFDDFCQIINPYDGYIYEIGELPGTLGTFAFIGDQENDGYDEYYFLTGNNLDIYNLHIPTFISDNTIPEANAISRIYSYPNPFNQRSYIQFNLKAESKIKLDIFDITGRKIETLFDGSLSPGSYNIPWDAGNLASGIYFAQITLPDNILTTKMVLLK